MFKAIRDIFKTPELRNKVLFTLAMLALVRLGSLVPSPLINGEYVQAMFASAGDFVELFDLMSGSAFSQMNLFAMGVQPYINASIIMSLLCVAIPALEEIQQDGEAGQKKINQYTRYLTIILALIQSFGLAYALHSYNDSYEIFYEGIGVTWGIILSMGIFMAGSMFVMWIGETITEKGLGNGVSLIIMINILSGIPRIITTLSAAWNTGWWKVVIAIIVMLIMIVFIVVLELAERRIPIQYAKQMHGRKSYGGNTSYIPIRVNMAGVIPIIFASSILSMPSMITAFFTNNPEGWWGTALEWISTSHPLGACLYVILVVAFTYFYTSITFNPLQMSENLRKNGGFIEGIRPGKPTYEYLKESSGYCVTLGAIALAIICAIPIAIQFIFGIDNMVIGGSSIMIVVGVALEIVKSLESQLTMRNYKSFMGR